MNSLSQSEHRNRLLHGFSWSTIFLVVTRAIAIASVPIVLNGLGSDLYAVWVLAGALVMIQSLFDLGVASALVRFVAVAAAAGQGRSAIVTIARRATIFYVGLSVAVFLPLWFGAREVVGIVHFLKPTELDSAVVIVRWAAAAFVLTNMTLVAASVLQGIDRVGASYRDQTFGWLLYLPLLLVGSSLGSNAQAVGVAWVGAYLAQAVLLSRSLVVGLRSIPPGHGSVPSVREMLSFGGRWQVSAWADFATFQLPRFIAGAALSSGDVVGLDVAIRAGQLVAAPMFAFYPTVLPRAASLLEHGGADALRSFLQRCLNAGAALVATGLCVLIPIETPALAMWTGRATASFSPLVAAAVLIGTCAHASTGLLSSALLARGDVRPVVVYKGRQLLAAAILLSAAAPIGLLALAIALCLSLALPAIAFNVYVAREFGLSLQSILAPVRSRWALAGLAIAQVAIPMSLVVALRSSLASWQLLLLALATAVVCLVLEIRLFMGGAGRGYWRRLASSLSAAGPSAADHLARK